MVCLIEFSPIAPFVEPGLIRTLGARRNSPFRASVPIRSWTEFHVCDCATNVGGCVPLFHAERWIFSEKQVLAVQCRLEFSRFSVNTDTANSLKSQPCFSVTDEERAVPQRKMWMWWDILLP